MSDFSIFKDGWKDSTSVCGWGSDLHNTENIRKDIKAIIELIRDGNNTTIINDAGCGDLWWIRTILKDIPNIDYVGYDLFERPDWSSLEINCEQLNICEKVMRQCDLILCRDVFIHFPNELILQALDLFKKSGKYLYSTMYSGEYLEFSNYNRITDFSMKHSKLNLCSEPFNLGFPIYITEENYQSGYSQKLICVWKL
jgi:hypothetical protein